MKKEITTTKEALNYIRKNVCQVNNIGEFKYHIFENRTDYGYIKNDKELIEYANEQKEAII